MEIRRAADAMLRFQTSPIAALLTPSLSTRCQGSRRASSQTIQTRAPPPRTTTSSRGPTSLSRSDLSRKLDWKAGGSSWTTPSATTTVEEKMDGSSANMDELLDQMNEKMRSRQPVRNTDFSLMADVPGSRKPRGLSPMSEIAALQMPSLHTRAPLKLNPSLGRTYHVGGNIDLGRALRMLEQSCSRNKIKKDERMQRFHERPGLKRKRVRREGWRKRFKHAFVATVQRVKVLKKQGW